MAPNPLTYSELEAYERKALVSFTAWETDLLMRLDDAVLGVTVAKAAEAGQQTSPDGHEQIPVTDVPRLREMVKATAARAKLIAEAKAQAGRR